MKDTTIKNLNSWNKSFNRKTVEVNSFVVYDSDLVDVPISSLGSEQELLRFIRDNTCCKVEGTLLLRFPENSEMVWWYESELGRTCYEQKIFEEVV